MRARVCEETMETDETSLVYALNLQRARVLELLRFVVASSSSSTPLK